MDLGSGAPVKEKDMVFPNIGNIQIKIKKGKLYKSRRGRSRKSCIIRGKRNN